jgi:hypothetical protein
MPVRLEPSHRSEQVTQLLFGEHYEVLGAVTDWLRIRIAYDGYEGFIPQGQNTPLEYSDYNFLQKAASFLSYDLVQLMVHDNKIQTVVLGSVLPFFENEHCRITDKKYKFDGNAKFPDKVKSVNTLLENTFMYLNAPYLWGGRSPFGIDCSGFTQMVFKLSGYKLQRDASQQAEQGMVINLIEEAAAGDLAFFDNEEGKITHVGILTAKDKIIHASGKVRIDSFDQVGIFNLETKRYSHKLRIIKRIIQ